MALGLSTGMGFHCTHDINEKRNGDFLFESWLLMKIRLIGRVDFKLSKHKQLKLLQRESLLEL